MIETPAIRFSQDDVTLYVTVLTAREVNAIGVVDEWTPGKEDTDPEQGYQRAVVQAHAKRIAKYLVGRDGDRLMPTAVVLSAREPVGFRPLGSGDASIGTLRLERPLYKVDGQHRSEGFSLAAEVEPELDEFQVPVVVMESRSKLQEVRQFVTINDEAKRVRTDLADRLRRAIGDYEEEKKGWRKVALEIVDSVGGSKDGPWEGRIKLPNAPNKSAPASQRSWTQSLRPLLTGERFKKLSPAEAAKAIENFWLALRELMPEAFATPGDFVIQKSVGVFALHRVADYVFKKTWPDLTVDTLKKVLVRAEQYVDTDFWRNTKGGGRAPQFQGMGGFAALADEIIEVLSEEDEVVVSL